MERNISARKLAAGLAALSAAMLMTGGNQGLQTPRHLSGSLPAPLPSATALEVQSISRWLWPGAFETPAGSAGARLTFVASGRRYVAEARSDGLSVRYGTNAADALEVGFAGGTPGVMPELAQQIPGALSLLTGLRQRAYPSLWQRFEVATFRSVWPGVGARFHAHNGDLELDFLVSAGADPNRIRLVARGHAHFEMDGRSRDVFIVRGHQRFRLLHPRAFQTFGAGSHEVAARAATDGASLWFELSGYDRTRELVIDPLVSTWSTFVGTDTDAMYDDATALATDASGNLYVGGSTQLDVTENPSDSFPTTLASLDPANPRSPGNNCAFGCGYVLKLSPTHQVLYGALLYGLTVEAIAVDASNEAVITGSTLDSTNFPGTSGVFDNDPSGEAFVSKISADGSNFVYSALFPGDSGNGVAVDTQGDAYVVGQISTSTLPTTSGTIKPANPTVGGTLNQDGFLLKVSPDGSTLLYGTYLGGSGTDVANAVQVDSQGEAIVVGQTASNDFTGLASPVSGASDAFIVKVSADASQIVSGQIFGGSGDDSASAVAPDGQSGWLLCGSTTSADFPISANAFQSHLLGQTNGWVRRVDSAFNPVYATYFGGSAIDGCLGIAEDSNADAYLVGVTFSADLPVSLGAFQDMTSAVTDDNLINLSAPFYVTGQLADREAYFAELAPDGGSVLYGSYLGGFETSPRYYPPLTVGSGITLTPTGTVYVSGATDSASFPVTDGGLRSGMGGQQDGFITAFANSALAVSTPSLLPAAPLSLPYSVTLSAAGGTPPYTWSQVGFELPTGLTLSSGGVLSGTATNPQQESTGYQFTVKVTDAAGAVAYKSLFVNVLYPGQVLCESDHCVTTLVANQAFSYQLPTLNRAIGQVTGVVTGDLPLGISLSSSGLLAGTPQQPGVYGFTAHLQDQSGQTGDMTWMMWISPSSTSVSALTVTPASLTVGQSYTLSWGASDSSGCQAGGGGASGAPWTGVLASVGTTTQTATTAGTFTYTVSCEAGTGPVQASASLSVTPASITTGSSSGGSGGSGSSSGGGKGGGGSIAWLDLAALLLVNVARRRGSRGRSTARFPARRQ